MIHSLLPDLEEITLSIDNSGPTPWIRWKISGDPLFEWKMMRISEHGNLWIPDEMRK